MKKVGQSGFRDRGFALVATLALLVLILVIAMGMLPLATISVSNTDAETASRQARANAKMAIMIAIGELQKYAGRDQAVTSRGAILGAPNEAVGTSTTVQPWLTGVRPTAHDVDGESIGKELELRKLSHSGAYLVSGNERFTVTEGGQPTPVGYTTPLSAISSPSVKIGDFSSDGKKLDVKVPLTLTDSGSSNGAYAYWVEDEGVKARISLTKWRKACSVRDCVRIGLASFYPHSINCFDFKGRSIFAKWTPESQALIRSGFKSVSRRS